MNTLTVTVCNCSNCIMNGAMEIIEAIESLKKLKVQYRMKANVHIETAPLNAHVSHDHCAPVVMVNNATIENARAETVMSKVLEILNGGDME